MIYDRTEAKILFARSHEKRDPIRHYKQRDEVTRALLAEIVQAAEEAGYSTGPQQGMQVIAHPGKGTVYLSVADAVLHVSTADGHQKKDLPIEYDAGTGILIGLGEDSFYTPEPGKPKKRRSAVAAIAEVIIKMIDEEAESRHSK